MSGMLSTGLNGLRAFQLAIDVTSQNVVNANTDGYVRQRAELATRPAVPSAGAWLASGVQVARIAREVDVYRVAQSRDAATQAQNAATRMQEIGRVVAALGRGQDGLPGALQRVRDALEALTAAPATRSVRVELLAKLDDAATEIRAVDARWRDFDREWGQRMTTLVGELNADARAIADLNRQIAIGAAAAGTPSPTLLDQRDQLLDRLAGYADLRVVEDAEGKVNVFAGRGRALVVGDVATAVKAEDFAADSGGTLGALAYSRAPLLSGARDELGALAAALAERLNTTHAEGVDGAGRSGTPLFSTPVATVTPRSGNTGSATVVATLDDTDALTIKNYRLQRVADAWVLSRLDDGTPVPMSGSGSVVDPLRAEGLAIEVSGVAANGDGFEIYPTRELACDFTATVTDPTRVAAAASGLGPGDNGNARRLLLAFDSVAPSDAGTTLIDRLDNLQLRLSRTQQIAARDAEVTQVARADIDRQRSNVSGVNLDEEAARLLQLQQAYQAAAQVVRMSDELFRTLLDATH